MLWPHEAEETTNLTDEHFLMVGSEDGNKPQKILNKNFGGKFIPLAGNTVSNPISGNLSFEDGVAMNGSSGQSITFIDNFGVEIAAQAGPVIVSSYAGEVKIETGHLADINLVTYSGKAYYNDKEIATVDQLDVVGDFIPLSGNSLKNPISGHLYFGTAKGLFGDTNQSIIMSNGAVAIQAASKGNIYLYTSNGGKALYNGSEIATVNDIIATVDSDFIPLTGTEQGKPITGSITMADGAYLKGLSGQGVMNYGENLYIDGGLGNVYINAGRGSVDLQATMNGRATYKSAEIATVNDISALSRLICFPGDPNLVYENSAVNDGYAYTPAVNGWAYAELEVTAGLLGDLLGASAVLELKIGNVTVAQALASNTAILKICIPVMAETTVTVYTNSNGTGIFRFWK